MPKHLPALDGLRGMAALIVLASHCANEGWVPSWLGAGLGQLGVALFYVLSGFLMMHFAIRRPLDRHSLRRYAVARTSRVLPLYFLAVAITTALYFPAGGVSFYGVDEQSDLIHSWLVFRGAGVLWSVPVELHFYLLFPLLWWAHSRNWFAWAVAALLAGCAILALVAPMPDDSNFLPYWLHWFLIGTLVRWLMDNGQRSWLPHRPAGAPLQAAAWVLFGLTVLLPPQLRGVLAEVVRIDPLTIALVSAILWFAALQIGPFTLLKARFLRGFGAISYGVYLLHSPVISMIKYLHVDRVIGPGLSFALTLGASTLGAWLSYRLFERPVQDALRRRFDRPSIAAQP